MRLELKAFTEQTQSLIGTNKQLKMKNNELKSSAMPETMAQLSANSSQPAQTNAYSAPANSQYSVTQPK